jgi:hypothetical protein
MQEIHENDRKQIKLLYDDSLNLELSSVALTSIHNKYLEQLTLLYYYAEFKSR